MAVDRITSGPLTAAGTNPYDTQALVHDTANDILEISGNDRVLRALEVALQILTSQTALSNVTTAQNLISKALGAGVLNKVNRTIRIWGRGIYTTPGTTTPAMSVLVALGATTLCTITTAALSATASTNMPFEFYFQFTTVSTGASGTLESHGELVCNISANTPAAAAADYLDTNTAVSSAVNLAGALTLTVQVSANSAITSIQLRQASIEVVN